MATKKSKQPAAGAWGSILDLIGWGSNTVPRFPMVAAEYDLSPKQLGLLWKLDPDGAGLPMREIGEALICDASYVTDMVDKLEERELIERQADPGDRRVKLLALTRKGKALRAEALDRLYKPPKELLDLDPADQELLNTILARAVANRAQDTT